MKHKKLSIILSVILILAAFVLSNSDLMHFEYDFLGKRLFDPEIDEKGNYILSETFVLKPGSYELNFFGSAEGRGASVFLMRGESDIFTTFDLDTGDEKQNLSFTISGSSENLRIGISYDPAAGVVNTQKISVTSNHVLYKSSLLRHAAISFFILLIGTLVLVRICFPRLIFRLFPLFHKKENETDFYLLVLLSLILSVPYLLPDSYSHAEDLFFHLSRIEGIAEGIRAGYFPVRNELFWLKNYGYGTGYFYPDLFLYFPVLLRLLGFSLLTCCKIFIIVCTFFSLGSFYLTTRTISENRYAGLASSVIFGFCTYRCIAVFYRAAIGEAQAFIFLPLIVLGIYFLFNGKPERWWIFGAGFWGLLSCHIISLTLAGCLTAIYFLIRIKAIISDRRILLGIIKAFLFTILLGAGFWLPMAEQMNGNSLNINILVSSKMGGLITNNVSSAKNLLTFFHDWQYDSNYSRTVYPGWIFLAIPFLRLILFVQKKKVPRAADIMLFSGIILMICSTDLFPWKYLVWFINRIQFTWRLLAPVSVLFPICGGIFFAEINKNRRSFTPLGILFILCAVCAFRIYADTILSRTVSEDQFIMQDNRVAGMEYLPTGLSPEFIDKNRDTVGREPSDIEITSHKRSGLSFTFSFAYDGDEPFLNFTVPLIRYHGYTGTYTSPDGKNDPIPVNRSENGLALVRVPNSQTGTIRVAYHKTAFEKTGEAISLLTLSAALYLFIRKKRSVCRKDADYSVN